jgi:tetraacyldisaccharide 4'-kinase
MDAVAAYFRIISGEAGLWAGPLRAGLAGLSLVYGAAVRRRNRRFDRGEREVARLPVPVVSVGNITTGGTGKTPLVIDLAQRCRQQGRTPAVAARGYKAPAGEPGDEQLMVSERLPGIACLANRDRVTASTDAIRIGADVILLDDGFQHRRVVRDLDIVVIDATNPFGFGHLLPRGLLREPLSALRRADVLVVSRADGIASNELSVLIDRLSKLAPDKPILRCAHRPTSLTDVEGAPAEQPGGRALLFAGIGNPESFADSVKKLGIEPAETLWWPDHHRYFQPDVAKIAAAARRAGCDVVLTTHKDAVKLRRLDPAELSLLRVVMIDVDYLEDDEKRMNGLLDSVLEGKPPGSAAEALASGTDS